MPRDLNMEPCAAQSALMTSLGFQQIPNSVHAVLVLWKGPHGLELEMDASARPDTASAVALVVHAALCQGKREVQISISKLLGLASSTLRKTQPSVLATI